MKSHPDVNVSQPASSLNFALGVAAGTFIGAGLMMWIAPRAIAEARRAVTDSANMFRDDVAGQYTNVSRRATAAIDEFAAKGRGARDDAADAVVRGAREVERIAVSVRAVPPKQL
jgi:hypothetical protein